MMTWTKVHLETMNILQLRELKTHVDDILKRKIKQSEELAKRDHNEDSGKRGS